MLLKIEGISGDIFAEALYSSSRNATWKLPGASTRFSARVPAKLNAFTAVSAAVKGLGAMVA